MTHQLEELYNEPKVRPASTYPEKLINNLRTEIEALKEIASNTAKREKFWRDKAVELEHSLTNLGWENENLNREVNSHRSYDGWT